MNFIARDVTQRLFFHRGDKVKITSISLEDSNGTLPSPTPGAYDKSVSFFVSCCFWFWYVSFQTSVQAYIPISNLTTDGVYNLLIEFEGTLDSQDGGPNHISYTLENGTMRYAASFPIPWHLVVSEMQLCSDTQSQNPSVFDIWCLALTRPTFQPFSISIFVTPRPIASFQTLPDKHNSEISRVAGSLWNF